jgi:hypothetical protein
VGSNRRASFDPSNARAVDGEACARIGSTMRNAARLVSGRRFQSPRRGRIVRPNPSHQGVESQPSAVRPNLGLQERG